MTFRELTMTHDERDLFPGLGDGGASGLWNVLIHEHSPVMKLWFIAMAVQIICLAVLFS